MANAPQSEQWLQKGFKYFNHFMVLLWRLGLGAWINLWPQVGGRILVITHKGRKSGLPRRTPVNYAIVNDELYITAGFGSKSDWYRNIQSNPEVQIWLPDGWYSGLAQEVSDEKLRLPVLRQVLINSGFAAYAFGGLNPNTISDEELQAATASYRLVRLVRTAPRTGPGGPSDLAWVWPLATFLLLPLLFTGRRSKRNCCCKKCR